MGSKLLIYIIELKNKYNVLHKVDKSLIIF